MADREDLSKASEQGQAASYADWYHKQQHEFDKLCIHFRYQMLKPYVQGPEGLELGPATGEMTRLLQQDCPRLTIVDKAARFLSCIPNATNLMKVHALFENFEP